MFQAQRTKMRAGVDVLVFNTIGFKTILVRRNKEGHPELIKYTTPQEDVTVLHSEHS